MAEQKIVQHRRDIYSNFAPSKIKPGEIIMITSGDPNSSSGKSVYACIAAGDVIQLATLDELSTYDQAAAASATAAAHPTPPRCNRPRRGSAPAPTALSPRSTATATARNPP